MSGKEPPFEVDPCPMCGEPIIWAFRLDGTGVPLVEEVSGRGLYALGDTVRGDKRPRALYKAEIPYNSKMVLRENHWKFCQAGRKL